MIPHLDILTIEQPGSSSILKNQSESVSFPLHAENQALILAMKDKLYQLGGVGLAAPQVGHNKKIIAIYIPEEAALLREHVKPYPMHILINPSYKIWKDSPTVHDFEGCYSVTSKAGKVPRYQTIRLTYQDENGQSHTTNESGFYARVLQHEIDHLNGLLITDRLTPDCLQGSVEDMMAIRRKELSPEQQEQFDKIMRKKFNRT
ncbi:peptide deformylase [Legionella nagasakiensis]|uniref:peptide deformylase n=1 Tax=Legionella nagasakiensis TaxID=535290 RepID=UPI001055DED3|nr:peptide deformylase [Legionella nagasakiensis]